jgi:hypothetical protein
MQELVFSAELRVLEDWSGSVEYGLPAPQVVYARFSGALSAGLGLSFVHELERLARSQPCLAYFSDARALTAYDLIARTRFQRLLMAERSRFSSVLMLTWASGIGPAARAFAAALGEGAEVLADVGEFERRLALAAPDWRQLRPNVSSQETVFRSQARPRTAWGEVAPQRHLTPLPRRS